MDTPVSIKSEEHHRLCGRTEAIALTAVTQIGLLLGRIFRGRHSAVNGPMNRSREVSF